MAAIDLNIGDLLTHESNKCAKLHLPELPLKVDAADVQGLVFRGYGALRECSYLLLRFNGAARARSWLGKVREKVSRGEPSAGEAAVHVAFTHEGLHALGLPALTLEGFSRSFIVGMTDEHTSRILGDVGDSAPECWEWGGPKTPRVHALLILLAKSAPELGALER